MYYNPIDFGERLRMVRKAAGMTQEELAEKLSVNKQHISRMERGVSACSIDLVVEISILFRVSTDFLLMGKSCSMEKEELRRIAAQLADIAQNM